MLNWNLPGNADSTPSQRHLVFNNNDCGARVIIEADKVYRLGAVERQRGTR